MSALATHIYRVIDASAELERFDNGDESAALRTYERLKAEANSRGLEYRKRLAQAIYLAGNNAMRGSRALDNCFENGDGDQVVAHLVDQARQNPTLERAIGATFGGTFPAKWIATAERILEPQPTLF